MKDTNLTSLAARLRQLTDENPQEAAATCLGETLSRQALDSEAEALAGELAEMGVGAGDYVSIVLPNGLLHPVATVATWKLGAVPQPLSPKLPPRELAEIIDLTRPAAVVAPEDSTVTNDVPILRRQRPLGRVDGVRALPDVISPAWKAATSGGSTGRPKVIRAGQPGVYERIAGYADILGLRPHGVSLVPAPLSHNGPFMVMALTLLTGGQVVLMPRFDPEKTLRLVHECRATFVYAVPTMMTRILKLPRDVRAAWDLTSIERWVHMGAPCPPEVKEGWLDWLGPEKVLEVYAGTEAQAITLIDGKQWQSHRGSVGRPVVGEIEVRTPDGHRALSGEVGSIWLRRPDGVPPTYQYVGAEAVADESGWETLGDMGYFDADGFLYLTGRASDMLLVGGSNVYPAEIESALMEHPAVLDACVIGVPDTDLGTAPLALICAAHQVSHEDLAGFLADRVAGYKHPRGYELVSDPMRDEAGKLRRSHLEEAWRSGRLPTVPIAPTGPS